MRRRAFLIGAVAITGGVAFGAYRLARPHGNPLLAGLKPGEAAFTPYIKITEVGITLITPHAETGQGAQTMQAALIAEELDVELDQVTLSFGAPDPAYYNTALASDAAPFAPFDTGLVAEAARGVMGTAFKALGVMVTGGSTSAPDSYVKLRHAGAVARETLKRAAADETGLDIATLVTKGGAVILPDGTRLPYTALAARAASTPLADPSLRDPSDWRILGKPFSRHDTVPKSTGTQVYGIDQTLPGMLHAAIRLSPRRSALESYDATAARAMRGVEDVLEIPGGLAVLADNTWRAFKAAEALEVTWAPAPYPPEMDAHWQAVSESFTDERLDRAWRSDGTLPEMDEALEYRAPYVAHAPLEPLSAMIRVEDAHAEVWAGHQMPRFAQDKIAEIVGCNPEDVTFHNQMTGGSFGHRLEMDFLKHAAQIAIRRPGTPIKLTYRREEDFRTDYLRPLGIARAQGAVENGRVTALSLDIAMPSTTASQMGRLGQPAPGPDPQIVAGAWVMPYAIPALHVRAFRVPELAPVSSWRAVGASSAGFFAESALDELIHRAGAEPMDERLRLCQSPVHRKTLEAVAEMSDWGTRADGIGLGVALVESFGVPCAQVVEVMQTPEGLKVTRVWAAADVGRVLDPVNFEAQVSGGIIWGLGHAMSAEVTFADGAPAQENYDTHPGMRLWQCPRIEVRGLENGPTLRGIGEPGVPPAPPALANAIFAATGQRLRQMPFSHYVDFV
ncbi:MAG: molybdopterin cofactor-binding domain-containing protein [Roseovarius sp.]